MKYNIITYLLVFSYAIVSNSCKSKCLNQIVVSNSIDTSELVYEKVFPQAYYDSLENDLIKFNPGIKKQKRKITDEYGYNIAIVYLYENGKLVKHDDPLFNGNKYFSSYCHASFLDDTLTIRMQTESFDKKVSGIIIKIIGNCYSSYYYEKTNWLDNSPIDRVNAKNQKLILNKMPILEWGRVLTGEFEGVFEPTPENNYTPGTNEIKVRVIFRGSETQYFRI